MQIYWQFPVTTVGDLIVTVKNVSLEKKPSILLADATYLKLMFILYFVKCSSEDQRTQNNCFPLSSIISELRLRSLLCAHDSNTICWSEMTKINSNKQQHSNASITFLFPSRHVGKPNRNDGNQCSDFVQMIIYSPSRSFACVVCCLLTKLLYICLWMELFWKINVKSHRIGKHLSCDCFSMFSVSKPDFVSSCFMFLDKGHVFDQRLCNNMACFARDWTILTNTAATAWTLFSLSLYQCWLYLTKWAQFSMVLMMSVFSWWKLPLVYDWRTQSMKYFKCDQTRSLILDFLSKRTNTFSEQQNHSITGRRHLSKYMRWIHWWIGKVKNSMCVGHSLAI